jgi:hypothetical protein
VRVSVLVLMLSFFPSRWFPLGGANVATLRFSDFFEPDLFETMPKP